MAQGAEARVAQEQESEAQILLFPAVRSCFTCVHWRSLDLGATSWCEVYDQTIDSEAYEAEECFTYEFCPEGEQPLLDEDPRE